MRTKDPPQREALLPGITWLVEVRRLPVTQPDGSRRLQDVVCRFADGTRLRFYCESERKASSLCAALSDVVAALVAEKKPEHPWVTT